MSTKRDLGTTLETSLMNGDPFVYAHLIKFERALSTQSGKPAESATDYAYITDGSFDISFDDGSKDLDDNSNGTQVYIANRLKKVGAITETTEAKASSITIQIASESLNTETLPQQNLGWATSGSATTAITTTGEDFVELGFSEGDKVTIKRAYTSNSAATAAEISADTNHNQQVIINSFSNNNKTITGTIIGADSSGDRPGGTDALSAFNGGNYILELSTDEVASLLYEEYDLNNLKDTSYAGYINREVFIYKTHINPETGVIIGVPYLIFKGIISKAVLKEDPTRNSTISWTLSSHWGDWERVTGRVTSDTEHRGISGDGKPDPKSVHRRSYASDLGFQHAETSINMIAIYQVMETRYKMKSSGLFGLKKKLKKYQVEVDREVDLRFNLSAKHLPVIYGVQRTDSIPVFADTLDDSPNTVHVVYAICEGEVGGLYDMYIDDQSRICIDKNDEDVRSGGSDAVDVVCEGRMDKGDTLSSTPVVTSGLQSRIAQAQQNMNHGLYAGGGIIPAQVLRALELAQTGGGTIKSDTGLMHEQQTSFKDPIGAKAIFHAGRPHQRANDRLVAIAQDDNFKLQQDYDKSNEYWNSQSRLLDTAYLAVEYTVAEGDVTIPEIDFVVRGREIDQFNYDYSYESIPDTHSALPSFTYEEATQRGNFKLGDKVDFYAHDGSAYHTLAQDVYIQDKYLYVNGRGENVIKFRFLSNPLLKSDDSVYTGTDFYMVPDGGGSTAANRYHFMTWDYKSHSGTVPSDLKEEVNTDSSDNTTGTITNNSTEGLDIEFITTALQDAFAHAGEIGVNLGFITSLADLSSIDIDFNIFQPQYDANTDKAKQISNSTDGKEEITHVFVANAIQLATSAKGGSGTGTTYDDYYKGQNIEVTRTLTDGSRIKEFRRIVSYHGVTRVAFVGDITGGLAAGTAIAGKTTIGVQNSTTVVLNTTSGLAVGDVVDVVQTALQIVPEGTVIASIVNGTTITLNQSIYSVDHTTGRTLAFTRPGAPTDIITPGVFEQFVPQTGDKYTIYPAYGDKKISINPAIQLLDYMTNTRYGRGLDLNKDINLSTFQQTARLCDTRSDITMFVSLNTLAVNEVYKFVDDGSTLRWQGTVKEVDTTARAIGGTNYYQVTFTDCIGKIATKWADWKSFEANELVWNRDNATNISKLYKIPSAGTYSLNDSNIDTANHVLAQVGGSKAPVISVVSVTNSDNSTQCSYDGNPVVKSWDDGDSLPTGSGYSLYDSDDIKYWRYMGWQEHNQREVTRHQTNAMLRTENPIFDNVNSLLEHFNGILRYSNGKYELDIETSVTSYSANDPRDIAEEDIIGAISIEDSGLKGSANSVSLSIPDPQTRYDARGVTFFNSDYLKQDRGIPKKKDIKTPLITNYFNARINAKQYLDQSRASKKINFKIGPKGVLLLAGTIIRITYSRFGWVNKHFRISNLNISPDCLVQVTAFEHDDDSYLISGKKKAFDSAGQIGQTVIGPPAPFAPTNLTASDDKLGLIQLDWSNSADYGVGVAGPNDKVWSTEILYNTTNSRSTGDPKTLEVITGNKETFKHLLVDSTTASTYYYWVRHRKEVTLKSGRTVTTVSAWHPETDGVQGDASVLGAGSGIVYLYKSSAAEPTDDPSDDSLFPTITVAISGTNAGKITGVASGQSSAAITNNQVIDTNGDATGWYTTPITAASGQSVWVIAATASSTGNTDEILRAEWTEPAKFSGSSGLNTATIELFQLNNSESSAPALPNGDLTYTFNPPGIAGSNFNDWETEADTPDASNKSLWKTTAAAISAEATTTVEAGDWSTAVRTARHSTDGADGNPGSNGTNGVNGVNGVALTLTASPVLFVFDGSAYDPSPNGASTLTLAASGGTITSVTWSESVSTGSLSNQGNSGATFTFNNDLTAAQVKDSATITATVTGTNSAGTTGQSFGTITVVPATTLQGLDGGPGGPGFFFIKRDDVGTTTNTEGQDLGKPSNSEVSNATEGNIVIVENTPTSGTPTQAAWKYTDQWEQVTDFFRAEVIAADAIGAKQLAISNDNDGAAGIYLNSVGDDGEYNIKIYDGTNNLRVKLGYIGT